MYLSELADPQCPVAEKENTVGRLRKEEYPGDACECGVALD